jgi:phosphate-selective porin OprO/OprP
MDLTDGNIIGGEADVFTIGLNWYLTSNTRLMANYGTVLDFNRNGFAGDEREPSVFQMRAQVYW